MPTQLTAADARESLNAHVAAKGEEIRAKYGPYIGWKELPLLNELLVGNQKRPYGLDHLNSSRYNVFLERPDIVEAFNQDARRFGACSYGYSDDLAYNGGGATHSSAYNYYHNGMVARVAKLIGNVVAGVTKGDEFTFA